MFTSAPLAGPLSIAQRFGVHTPQKNPPSGDNPRPVAPQLLLRGFDLHGGGLLNGSDKRATHVQLVVLNNQCTGNAHYQGEQDNDPANVTDCRLGSASGGFVPRGNDVRAAELQVFSSNPSVSGAELADDGHDDDN